MSRNSKGRVKANQIEFIIHEQDNYDCGCSTSSVCGVDSVIDSESSFYRECRCRNIDIYRRVDSNQSVHTVQHGTCSFEIVQHDTLSFNDRIYGLVWINVFTPSHCPYPFYEENGGSGSVLVRYRRKGQKAGDLVDAVLQSLRNTVHGNYYRVILDELRLCKHSYYIAKRKTAKVFAEDKSFKFRDDGDGGIRTLDMFMVRNSTPDINRPHRLILRFVAQGAVDLGGIKYIDERGLWLGFPLPVWVDTSDTLQSIISKYLPDPKMVRKTYRVSDGKLYEVAASRRDRHCPANSQLGWDRETVVLTVDQCAHVNMFRYSGLKNL